MIALESVETVRIDDFLWEIQEKCSKESPPHILNITIKSLPKDQDKLCITGEYQGFTIAARFMLASYELVTELKRKERQGLLSPERVFKDANDKEGKSVYAHEPRILISTIS